MAKQVINSGTIANDGTGDTLRAAAEKINGNFTELYDAVDAVQQVNSDWSATSGVTEILNKPDLFSGSYSDLTNIPVFADVAVTGSYVDLSDQPHLSSVAISGSYADLTNKPALFSGSYSDLTNKPTLFSGSYSDLTNKPTIPNNTTQLINGNNFITLSSLTWANVLNKPSFATVATSGSYADLTNKPSIPIAYSLPTATTSVLGGVKVDGTTITIADGVISSTGSGGGVNLPTNSAGYLKNNGTGTLSWDTPTLSGNIAGDLVFDGGIIGPVSPGVGIGMWGDDPTVSNPGGSIYLQGGATYVEFNGPATPGGNVIISAGQGSNEVEASVGGNIQIYSGAAATTAGNIRIEGGGTHGASGHGGDILIQSGSSLTGVAGNIDIQSGIGSEGMQIFEGTLKLRGSTVDVTSSFESFKIKTGDVDFNDPEGPFVWEFDNLGNLKLPVGGDILNSAGQTILAAQIQSDWNQLTNTAVDYIKNKPVIPATLTALGITDGTPGQVLTTDGFGTFTFTTVGGASGLASRNTSTSTTASLAANATENINFNGFKSYMLLKIVTSDACWVRIYSSEAARTADASRPINTDPTPSSGVIAEAVTTGAAVVALTPGVYGFNDEGIPTASIPVAITNKSGTTTTLTVVLTILKLEV